MRKPSGKLHARQNSYYTSDATAVIYSPLLYDTTHPIITQVFTLAVRRLALPRRPASKYSPLRNITTLLFLLINNMFALLTINLVLHLPLCISSVVSRPLFKSPLCLNDLLVILDLGPASAPGHRSSLPDPVVLDLITVLSTSFTGHDIYMHHRRIKETIDLRTKTPTLPHPSPHHNTRTHRDVSSLTTGLEAA